MVETKERIGDFEYINIAANIIIIKPHPTIYANGGIPMLGISTAVEKYIKIPYPHRLVRLVLSHRDATWAESDTKMALMLEVESGHSELSKYHTEIVIRHPNINVTSFSAIFGETFECEARDYTLTLASTTGHYIIPVLYIQRLGGNH